MKSHIALSLVLAAGTCASALAEELPQATAIQQSSLANGFGVSTLSVLQRAKGGSQAGIATDLHAAFCAECSSLNPRADGVLESGSDHYALTVAADGTAAEFRDLAVQARSHSQAVPLAQKMTAAVLQTAGLAFIHSRLASFVVLGQNESLVALRTDYRVEGIQELRTGNVTRSVAANRIVFGRTLNGVPVVGNGSTVVITFANDGSVESFHFDWPSYTVTGSQSMVGSSGLMERVQQAVSARTGTAAALQPVVQARVSVNSLTQSSGTQLQSMQCGYYDAGADAGLNSVQPGCVYHAVYQSPDGVRAGYAGAVPGGVQFAEDTHWVESRIVK
jgi:hypothetical protein